MPGVRIRPVKSRPVPDDSMIVLVDKSRPIPNKYNAERPVCSVCKVGHTHKAYHLQLRDGAVIVSETIWAKFQTMPDNGGFELMNVVEEPPTQGFSPGESAPELIEKYPVNEISPVGKMSRLATLLNPDKPSKSAKAGEGAI